MREWTNKRKASLAVHVGFVSVPFAASTVSAVLLWHALFNSWVIGIGMIAVIEVLSLAGLVLHIWRVPSPFTSLRHALPFISIGPLGREVYVLLAHNGLAVAVAFTLLIVTIAVYISHRCFVTIEDLFADPIAAAREKAQEDVRNLRVVLARFEETKSIVNAFVDDQLDKRAERITITQDAAPQLTDETSEPPYDKANIIERLKNRTLSYEDAAAITGMSTRQMRRWTGEK